MKHCKCGCGQAVTEGRLFVSGHNSRSRRKPQVDQSCIFCGNLFSGTAKAMAGRSYCSATCRDRHRRSLAGPAHPQRKRVQMSCAVCGVNIEALPNKLKNRPDQYCSAECGREGRARKIRGILKPVSHWRTLAKRTYGSRCVVCGFEHAVDVHHVVPRCQGGSNEVSNLVPLCPNHHVMIHMGLLSIAEVIRARDAA